MPIGTPVGGTVATNATAATTLAPAYPASSAAGDLLILRVILQSTTAMTTPSGWTVRASPSSSGTTTPRTWLFTRTAVGTESGTLSVTTPSAIGSARIYKVSGVDQTTPMDTTPATFSAGAVTDYLFSPGVTTTLDGAMLFVSIGCNAASGSFTPATAPGTFTETLDSPTAVHSMDAYLLLGAAGATGTVQTFTRSVALRGAAAMLALRPAVDVIPRNIRSSNPATIRSFTR